MVENQPRHIYCRIRLWIFQWLQRRIVIYFEKRYVKWLVFTFDWGHLVIKIGIKTQLGIRLYQHTRNKYPTFSKNKYFSGFRVEQLKLSLLNRSMQFIFHHRGFLRSASSHNKSSNDILGSSKSDRINWIGQMRQYPHYYQTQYYPLYV